MTETEITIRGRKIVISDGQAGVRDEIKRAAALWIESIANAPSEWLIPWGLRSYHNEILEQGERWARLVSVPTSDSATRGPGATVIVDDPLDKLGFVIALDDPIDADEGPRKQRKMSYKQLQRLSPAERAEYARKRGKREGA